MCKMGEIWSFFDIIQHEHKNARSLSYGKLIHDFIEFMNTKYGKR